MSDTPQALADVPTFVLILVALAGLVGEMRQADVPGVALAEILKRITLRFGSSTLFGMATLLILLALDQPAYMAGAGGIITGLLGADIAGAFYTRYLAKRAGLGDLERRRQADGAEQDV